jgi:hypothetical protein
MTLQTRLIEGSRENVVKGKCGQGYDIFYYSLEIMDNVISPKLKDIIWQISKLEKERDRLVEELSLKVHRPEGWNVSVRKVRDYGCLEVLIKTEVVKEQKPMKPETKLQKMLRQIDAKTLFNSGVLTKKEKRELLGLKNRICDISYITFALWIMTIFCLAIMPEILGAS